MYKLIIIGGTFDNLHKGHEAFLDYCLKNSQEILLGLTTDKYAKKIKRDMLQSFKERKKGLIKYFQKNNSLDRVSILPINSFMYPKIWENLPIDAIVVTEDTKKGADYVNKERKSKNLRQFKVIVAPIFFVNGTKISSSKIRKGETNKYGLLYLAKEWFDKDLILGEKERHWFKKPFGKLLTNNNIDFSGLKADKTATVGDFVTKLFNEKKVGQKISVIDFNIERKKSFENIFDLGFLGQEEVFKTENKAGRLSVELFKTISSVVNDLGSKNRIIINILGEEDLTVLPLALALPLGWKIFYGQPGKGTVMLDINLKNKDTAYKLLTKFTKKY